MTTATVYNRPVRVRRRIGEVARVQYLDTKTTGFVPVADLSSAD